MPSASVSIVSVLFSGNASAVSRTLSPSSSVSALLPIPSESVSSVSLLSNGKASAVSKTPSPSSSVSALLPVPSESVSRLSFLSNGKASAVSATPSASSSRSTASANPSSSASGSASRTVEPSNKAFDSVAVSKAATSTVPATSSSTEDCNVVCAASSISVLASPVGSSCESPTKVFTSDTLPDTAAIVSDATLTSGATSVIAPVSTSLMVEA